MTEKRTYGSSLSPRELLLVFLFWTSLAGLSVANRLIDDRGEGLSMLRGVGPLALPFIEAWLWAAVTPLILWLASRATSERAHWIVRALVLVAIGTLIAMAFDVVLEIARNELIRVPRRRPGGGGGSTFTPFRGIGRFRFLNQLLVYGAVLAAGFAREYFLRDQTRQHDAVSLQARTAQLEAQLAHARLDALRMQINPHFLFNTLHGISALVERDPSGVRRMIARLSELLRETLESRGDEEVTLRDELDFLQRYLDIMEVRFQGRLRVTRAVDVQTYDALVPNFILQPIVENALEHGVSRSTGEAQIEIAARRIDNELVLSVHDEGPGMASSDPRGDSGVGLSNTRARLAAMYGDAASLSIASAEGGGTTAEIRLPLRTESPFVNINPVKDRPPHG